MTKSLQQLGTNAPSSATPNTMTLETIGPGRTGAMLAFGNLSCLPARRITFLAYYPTQPDRAAQPLVASPGPSMEMKAV